jgi:oxygen-independent coproporphyrinogen-3 oxidase
VFSFTEPEITVELNLGQLEVSRVPELRALGVTRLSIGLQALDDTMLRRLGRAQGGEQALRGLEACLAAGFASLSADLIYGAPGQSLETLLGDVERVIDLGVPHVSAYALTLEPGTPFALAAERGKLDVPDETRLEAVAARLCAAGIAQYEISSYARGAARAQPALLAALTCSLGPSAASLVGERRFRNARELEPGERCSPMAVGRRVRAASEGRVARALFSAAEARGRAPGRACASAPWRPSSGRAERFARAD